MTKLALFCPFSHLFPQFLTMSPLAISL
uniref:Uncharacterized protein n=1 Tax=Rhizophora mucronata TaxID=61149 RepID=A0A2P2NEE0_RHIMU